MKNDREKRNTDSTKSLTGLIANIRALSLSFMKYLCIALILTAAALAAGCQKDPAVAKDNSLIVFNYGDYIDRETISMFEKETGIDVKYEEYLTPEDMYTKYSSGVIDYDLICTSDYMIQKMNLEGHLKPVNLSEMKYYKNIDPKYLDFCRRFDPDNKYAVPYLWGTVGILYNEDLVEEKPDSWEVLWNKNINIRSLCRIV